MIRTKSVAAVAAAMLLVGLAACGGNTQPQGSGGGGGAATSSASGSNSSASESSAGGAGGATATATGTATATATGTATGTATSTGTGTSTSTSSATSSASASGSSGAGGGAPCSPAPAQCNAPELCGSFVPFMQIAQNAPPPLGGGNIPDGTYAITGLNVYTGPNGQSGPTGIILKGTLLFMNGAYFAASQQMGMLAGGASGTFTTQGTSFTTVQTCPPPAMTSPSTYTLSGNTLNVYGSAGAQTTELVLVKLF